MRISFRSDWNDYCIYGIVAKLNSFSNSQNLSNNEWNMCRKQICTDRKKSVEEKKIESFAVIKISVTYPISNEIKKNICSNSVSKYNRMKLRKKVK